ncbi:MAG: Asp-tRNA(Asn)/Glu-tRNA(Gln) amidotransferase subunit GatB [Patescibacteria group bacterium]
MISQATRDKYTTTIGIECHVQLKTKTKLFSAVGNDAREAPPNTLVNHIDFGLPGALPVLNEEALHLATRAAFALGTEPERFSKFDRKHYFYPDLPKGYQISQYDEPIIGKGEITIDVNGEPKVIGITRAHLEEDAGKSTHAAGKDYSLVDLNRAGTPLLEIVSEPDMHTSAEAKAYARELYLRMKYADVSEANLYYGNMRFDVNVSVSQTDELGTRSETKNLNSFRSVEKAVEYEVTRQIELLEKGEKVVQETRGWDDAKQKTLSQRSKENADDYRYMPDPDIPPVVLTDEYIAKIGEEIAVMPQEWRERLESLGLDKASVETLIDAGADNKSYLKRIVDASKVSKDFAKFVANSTINIDIPFEKSLEEEQVKISSDVRIGIYKELYELYGRGELSSNSITTLIQEFLSADSAPTDVQQYATDKGYIQVSDEGEIAKIVVQVLADNPKAAEDVKNGEMKAVGFLVGQVMKLSKGKANPSLAQDLIKKQLDI